MPNGGLEPAGAAAVSSAERPPASRKRSLGFVLRRLSRRRWLDTLQAQVTMTLLLGVVLALLLAAGMLLIERTYDWRSTWVHDQSDRITTAVAALNASPVPARPTIAAGMSNAFTVLRIGVPQPESVAEPTSSRVQALLESLRDSTGFTVHLMRPGFLRDNNPFVAFGPVLVPTLPPTPLPPDVAPPDAAPVDRPLGAYPARQSGGAQRAPRASPAAAGGGADDQPYPTDLLPPLPPVELLPEPYQDAYRPEVFGHVGTQRLPANVQADLKADAQAGGATTASGRGAESAAAHAGDRAPPMGPQAATREPPWGAVRFHELDGPPHEGAQPWWMVPALRAGAERVLAELPPEAPAQRGGPLGGLRRLWLAVPLESGAWLYVRVAPEPPPPPRGWALALAGVLLAAGIVLTVRWAVRRAVRPVQALSSAASRLAADAAGTWRAEPLSELGPREARDAARAFNRMQQRVDNLLAERVQVLGALAHDLQTPVTRMRLRAESIEPEPLRERLIADLEQMQALVREGLDYARHLHQGPDLRPTDLADLLDAMAADWLDQGRALDWQHPGPVVIALDPVGIRRAVGNLLDNAWRYGAAPFSLSLTPTLLPPLLSPTVPALGAGAEPAALRPGWLICVRDHGPGLPEQDLTRVLRPFERGEVSRNRSTGGAGLGLAIVDQVARQHQGSLQLQAADGGGLEVWFSLPAQPL